MYSIPYIGKIVAMMFPKPVAMVTERYERIPSVLELLKHPELYQPDPEGKTQVLFVKETNRELMGR
jgi:hypothetical protein